MANAGKIIVYAVHGTWPYGYIYRLLSLEVLKPKMTLWFESNSPVFEVAREAAADAGMDLVWRSFRWSGNNSFTARKTASACFASQLMEECGGNFNNVNIICHSHGGNVALDACKKIERDYEITPPSIISISTPFFHISENIYGRVRSVTDLLWLAVCLPVGVLLSAVLLSFANWNGDGIIENSPLYAALSIQLACICAYVMLIIRRYALSSVRRETMKIITDQPNVPEKYKISIIRGTADEATAVIGVVGVLNQIIIDLSHFFLLRMTRLMIFKDEIYVELSVYMKSLKSYVSSIIIILMFVLYAKKPALYVLIYALVLIYVFINIREVLVIVASVIAAVLVIPVYIIMAIAIGPEVLRVVGGANYFIESAPVGIKSNITVVDPMYRLFIPREEKIILSHSMFDQSNVRRKIFDSMIEWISSVDAGRQ